MTPDNSKEISQLKKKEIEVLDIVLTNRTKIPSRILCSSLFSLKDILLLKDKLSLDSCILTWFKAFCNTRDYTKCKNILKIMFFSEKFCINNDKDNSKHCEWD